MALSVLQRSSRNILLQLRYNGFGKRKLLPSNLVRTRFARAIDSTTSPLNTVYSRVHSLTTPLLHSSDQPIPAEQRVLGVLEQLDSLAHTLPDEGSPSVTRVDQAHEGLHQEQTATVSTTATSALLGSVDTRQPLGKLTNASLRTLISEKAEAILRHPNVFITPAILSTYVRLQTHLSQPGSFPAIFDLYAAKAIPTAATPSSNHQPVTYLPASPANIKSAVSAPTASAALTLAITTHDLPLALDIITTTFCTPAFKKAKILRYALIPMSALAAAPLAAYTLSTQVSHLQTAMDPAHATGVVFAGVMTYVAAVASMGYVAVTTANDQMDRVTWATGVPLWERWVREEERAALDRVAGRWGFTRVDRRGDEEGEEWEALREFVGRRGMVLDRAELMDGME